MPALENEDNTEIPLLEQQKRQQLDKDLQQIHELEQIKSKNIDKVITPIEKKQNGM